MKTIVKNALKKDNFIDFSGDADIIRKINYLLNK